MPNFDYENSFKGQVVGVDEVGRGCIAGMVVACAAYLKKDTPEEILCKIKDSKLLSSKKREEIVKIISPYVSYAIGQVDVATIDNINILQASLKAMQKAVLELNKSMQIDAILIDGNQKFEVSLKDYSGVRDSLGTMNPSINTIIKGDQKSYSIAIASILAKVYRDNIMSKLGEKYPYYLWDKNAGYGTKAHLDAMEKYGITEHHRKSFAPCRKYF